MTETPFWLWYKLEIIWLGDGEPLIHFSPVSLSQCEGRHYNSVAPAALAQESHPEYQLEMKYTFPPGSLPLRWNAELLSVLADPTYCLDDDLSVLRLRDLDRGLKDLLSSWFSVGLLKLEMVDWQSPCNLLQVNIGYLTIDFFHVQSTPASLTLPVTKTSL